MALVLCSSLKNLLVIKLSRIKTFILLLKAYSYQAVVTKHLFCFKLTLADIGKSFMSSHTAVVVSNDPQDISDLEVQCYH